MSPRDAPLEGRDGGHRPNACLSAGLDKIRSQCRIALDVTREDVKVRHRGSETCRLRFGAVVAWVIGRSLRGRRFRTLSSVLLPWISATSPAMDGHRDGRTKGPNRSNDFRSEVIGRSSAVLTDLEPLVVARQLLHQDFSSSLIAERLRHEYDLESSEAAAVVAAARALVQYESQHTAPLD